MPFDGSKTVVFQQELILDSAVKAYRKCCEISLTRLERVDLEARHISGDESGITIKIQVYTTDTIERETYAVS